METNAGRALQQGRTWHTLLRSKQNGDFQKQQCRGFEVNPATFFVQRLTHRRELLATTLLTIARVLEHETTNTKSVPPVAATWIATVLKKEPSQQQAAKAYLMNPALAQHGQLERFSSEFSFPVPG